MRSGGDVLQDDLYVVQDACTYSSIPASCIDEGLYLVEAEVVGWFGAVSVYVMMGKMSCMMDAACWIKCGSLGKGWAWRAEY